MVTFNAKIIGKMRSNEPTRPGNDCRFHKSYYSLRATIVKKQVLLSVITLTKNRANLLEKCLTSLKGQLLATDEVVIIDNNSTDDTQRVIRRYQQELPIYTYKTSLTGYPNLYNFAISKSKKNLLVFLDDDCVATPSFVSRIRERFKEKQDFVLQGKTRSLPRNNIYAEISEDHLTNWIDSNVAGNNKLRVIDNRNVTIPKAIIKEVGGFSTKMKIGSEDVEFGMRLFRMGIPIVYDTSIAVYHHERTTMKEFLLQHYRIAQSHAILDESLLEKDKVFIVNRRTWIRNFQSALALWIRCWREKRYENFFKLPLVYLLLGATRVVGYGFYH